MINLKVETGSPDCDRKVIEKMLVVADIDYTTRIEDNYIIIGVKDSDTAIARYELRMHSFRIV